MFTGLIEDTGTLEAVERHGDAAEITVRTTLPTEELRRGDSVAVNGACLTAEAVARGRIVFHAMAETLSRTNLGQARPGTRLNLERALKLGRRLGGHIVTGHVDFCGKIEYAGKKSGDYEIIVSMPPEYSAHLVEKGSVAVNGVSLTVAQVQEGGFKVCIIPVTLADTNLALAKKGDLVNIETDLLGKYVLRALSCRTAASSPPEGRELTMQALIDAGF